jgi:uncharacterized protein YndB with AHSA1/START domain
MATATKNNKEELTITRIFDAPRELVWKAWTDPRLLKQWWGPKDFTAPVSEIDLRVGGKYFNCMRGPDGKEYWSTGVYREIVSREKLVSTDSFADEKGNMVPASYYGMKGEWPLELLVTVTLEERGGKTTMLLRHEGIPAGEMRDLTYAGWSESFDKLAEILAANRSLTSIIAEPGKQEVVITRVFDAPRELVFKAYTDPDRIRDWWGPKRFTNTVERMDVRPGGIWRIVQRDKDGNVYAFQGVYHEVRPPERLVSTFEFEGAPGHVSLDTATFEEHEGRTKLVAKSVFQSVEDRDAMLQEGMEEGVIETMDRFADLLEHTGGWRKAA